MAFTNESPRDFGVKLKDLQSNSLGPGEYDHDIVKSPHESFIPKKKVPFNSNTDRFEKVQKIG